MPNELLRFEVLVNGQPIAVTGTNSYGVLSAIVSWVRRSPGAITDDVRSRPNFDEDAFLKETCELELGGMDSTANRHVGWPGVNLKPGDEVTIRILSGGKFDPPPPPPNKSLERTREG